MAQVILLSDTSRSAGLGGVAWDTQAEKCALLFKLKQRGLPQGSSVRRGACFRKKPTSSCLSQEEGGGRAGNQRLSHVVLGSIVCLQRVLPKSKRCFCPKSQLKSAGGPIKVLRWLFSTSLRAGWLRSQLHDILEQLEGPHDVVILGREEGGKRMVRIL